MHCNGMQEASWINMHVKFEAVNKYSDLEVVVRRSRVFFSKQVVIRPTEEPTFSDAIFALLLTRCRFLVMYKYLPLGNGLLGHGFQPGVPGEAERLDDRAVHLRVVVFVE